MRNPIDPVSLALTLRALSSVPLPAITVKDSNFKGPVAIALERQLLAARSRGQIYYAA